MKPSDYILNNELEVLAFLKGRYPLYHLSNVFFRDVQYGIQTLLERKNMRVSYRNAERIARDFVARLERKKMLIPIDRQTWALHYPEFRTPSAKAAAARPSVPPVIPTGVSAPTARPTLPPLSRPPAGSPGTARPPLPPINRPAPARAQNPVSEGSPASVPAPHDTKPTELPGGSPPSAGGTVPETSPAPAAPQPPQAEVKTSTHQAPRQLPPIRSSTPAGLKK